MGGDAFDAFTVVARSDSAVFALTPAGTTWVTVQTSQVAVAYGSSTLAQRMVRPGTRATVTNTLDGGAGR